MLSFNCFYNISHVLNHASVYATILVEIDDQYCAVLNASTSDAGTYTEVRFGQFEKVLTDIVVTLDTLFRYTSFKLMQFANTNLPISEHNCILTIDSAEQDANVSQLPNKSLLKDLHNGKLTDGNIEQFLKAPGPKYEQFGKLIDCNLSQYKKALVIKDVHNGKLTDDRQLQKVKALIPTKLHKGILINDKFPQPENA